MILIFPNINKIWSFFALLLITILLTRTVVTWSSWNEQKKSCCIITACQLGYLALACHPMKYGMMIILLYEKKVALWWEIVSIKSRLHFICFAVLLLCFHFEKEIVSNSNQQKKYFWESVFGHFWKFPFWFLGCIIIISFVITFS